MNLEHANSETRKHREAGDGDKATRAAVRAGEALSAIGKLIHAGHRDEATWHELVDAIKDMVGVAGVEHKRLLDLGQFLTVCQAVDFVTKLQTAVVEEVHDREVLGRISTRFAAAMNGSPASRASEPADEAVGLLPGPRPQPIDHSPPADNQFRGESGESEQQIVDGVCRPHTNSEE